MAAVVHEYCGGLDFLLEELKQIEKQEEEARNWTGDPLDRIGGNWTGLKKASYDDRCDKKLILAAVNQHWGAMEYALEDTCDDREILNVALSQHGAALQFASEALRADRELATKAVSQSPSALEFVSDELRDDIELVQLAVAKNGRTLRHASERLRDDRDLVLSAIAHQGNAIRFASERLKRDHDTVLAAVTNQWQAIELVPEEPRADREIIMTALRQNSETLLHTSKELLKDPDFVKEAVKLSGGLALQCADPSLQCDENFLEELMDELGPVRSKDIYILRITMLSGRSCVVVVDFHVIDRRHVGSLNKAHVLQTCGPMLDLNPSDICRTDLLFDQTKVESREEVRHWTGVEPGIVNEFTLVLQTVVAQLLPIPMG
mmetsp:Transcript_41646/g.75587  ORF Transcript_41646/g.75587 Transcript_41646/m.75587 type:complete len:377 (+) Transcript_41646:184-1314(+)